ncbi:MAG: hypothetical protein WC334_00335 [Kiritimatiellales bacterium]|jgi:hypothetical protein
MPTAASNAEPRPPAQRLAAYGGTNVRGRHSMRPFWLFSKEVTIYFVFSVAANI